MPPPPKGIKWEDLNDEVVEGFYSFIIENGCFERGPVNVAIKIGGQPDVGCNLGRIIGPTCQERPPQPVVRRARGFKF